MLINKDTDTLSAMNVLTIDDFNQLLEECEAVELDKPIVNMTCGEFIETLDDDYIETFFKEEKLFIAIGKLKQFRNEMEQINRFLKLNDFEPTMDEKQAQNGVHFPTLGEKILLTVTEYFHLHSFEEAEKIPFSNYLIIHKANTADAKFERNLNKIYDMKRKMNR